ncbi:hypothetical protein WH87_16445 [Devosia epidermidihirudinis]|uniref:DUF1217 domain-containing protein n=1 Tax=Devosia epidermidihirudinis TaxID=1293439 RepID=A0A0F5Q3Y2_9HYPH|nr:hypothetical protein [Devosia epidermidihirudinis]KKC35628.1 hypothetical protein WH87_16445 [Devosia epidermidihirudinis]
MVGINTAYSTNYVNHSTAYAARNTSDSPAAPATGSSDSAATNVTLSDAAKAAISVKDFATVVTEALAKLKTLLTEAERTSPLEGGKLALNLGSLDARELYAMSTDKAFSADELKAADLEMQRRFEAALAGPAAVAKVSGNYLGLYKAAAEYLDSLGSEEKAGADWIAGRAAVTEGLKQLQADPKTLPKTSSDDPVALYLALAAAGQTTQPTSITDVATSTRKTLDKLYADAIANGKAPTFNKQTTVGTFIDMSKLDSRSLSSIVLDTTNQFSPEEVRTAKSTLHGKSGAALLAGFNSAAKSSDPSAFSQNIISLFASLSPEERQAAGWTDKFYQAAVESYQSTNKLTQMFAEAGGETTGFMSWMGK